MKETILFSNIIENCEECSFNANTACILRNLIKNNQNLVFINAPQFKNEDNCFDKILKCFNRLGINFANTIEISDISKIEELAHFPQNRVYFLMDGNPITQYGLIKKYNLIEELKNYDGVVIGFGAGAINLSKNSIITSDEDFDEALYYNGINRIDLTVEPHFNIDNSEFTKQRIQEIKKFSEILNTEIYAMPENSAIDIIDDSVGFYGEIYKY